MKKNMTEDRNEIIYIKWTGHLSVSPLAPGQESRRVMSRVAEPSSDPSGDFGSRTGRKNKIRIQPLIKIWFSNRLRKNSDSDSTPDKFFLTRIRLTRKTGTESDLKNDSQNFFPPAIC